MTPRRPWSRMTFFWKTFYCLVLVITIVVGLTEIVFEPFAKVILLRVSDGFKPWHEVILWAVSIIIPSLGCGFIFSRILARKLDAMAAAADRLALGDFSPRVHTDQDSQDSFSRLSRSFNDMAASLGRLMQNERRLLADISHELRSPLARMNIALALLPLKHDPLARLELQGRLEKEVEQMGQLVGLLLQQGRDRLSGLEPDLVDLSALVREIAEDIHFQGQPHDKKSLCAIPDDARVYGNARQLRTMLMNVAANALFYTPPGGAILFQLERDERHITVRVRDYGPGVPDEQLEDIFRAFYRVDDSRTRSSGGTGLGLALAREAVLDNGGTITARNASPGLEVCIRLPATALQAES